MNRSAVLHIPMSQYAYPVTEDTFTVRLRAAKGDLDCCTLFYGDRACPASPVVFTKMEMKAAYEDELFTFFEGTIHPCPRRICYYFALKKGEEETLYYADAFHQRKPDVIWEDGFVVEGRSEYYQYPYILRSEIFCMPEWFLQAAVYQIFPDSFADGKERLTGAAKRIPALHDTISTNRCGGTIRGILENLDYIQELGFTCLYLNPIFCAGEYHKYDTVDYFHIDPCLGTDADFLKLTDAVHQRKMRIIIDGVFNHISWQSPFFKDVVAKGEKSAYRDWFYELKFPVKIPEAAEEIPEYACFAYEKRMPKLNTANPAVQEYFAKVGRYWMERFHVDGWRLDVANEADRNFWRSFRREVLAAKPDAVLVGEVWENAENWLKGDMFDSVMNYDFRKHCRDFFAEEKIRADVFAWRMTDMLLRYPGPVSLGQLNLLDSHDVARFLSLCGGQISRWKAAFLFLMMAPGVPCVFYGDEKEIGGWKETEYRSPMPWENECRETGEFVKTVLKIRRDWLAPEAAFRMLKADGKENLLVFERTGRHRVRVLLHLDEKPVNAASFCMEGQVLLANGMKETWMQKDSWLVLLMP